MTTDTPQLIIEHDDTPKLVAINDTIRLLLSVLDLREPIEERTRLSLLRTISVCAEAVAGIVSPSGVFVQGQEIDFGKVYERLRDRGYISMDS